MGSIQTKFNNVRSLTKRFYYTEAATSTRAYSTPLAPESIKDKGNSFYEWFGGFTVAEGTFYFKKQNNLYFVFIYQITLHVDDIDVLTRIKDILGLGKITISKSVCVNTFLRFSNLIFKKTKRFSRLENYLKFKGHGPTIYG